MNRAARKLDAEGRAYRRSSGLLSFPEADGLRYILFGQRSSSPTDRSEHFRHADGAEALIGVWIASDELAGARGLLAGLGVAIVNEEVDVPEAVPGSVARLPLGEVVFLPGSRQLVPGRRIVEATLRVRALKFLQRALAKGPWKTPPVVQTKHGSSVFLPPGIAHGIWLEFRQER
jgi:DNA-binding transcriptional LysR family regulator